MTMTAYRRTAFVALVVAMFTLLASCTPTQKTYNKYGISFDYPADMAVEERGVIGFSKEITEISGSLRITKPGTYLEISWMGPFEDADSSYITKLLGSYLAGRKTTQSRLYLGDGVESKQSNHTVLGTRFCSEGSEGYLLNMAGAWYCEKSKKVFLISSGSRWTKPAIIVDGRTVTPEWPKLKKDDSYKMYKNVLGSFHCHRQGGKQ